MNCEKLNLRPISRFCDSPFFRNEFPPSVEVQRNEKKTSFFEALEPLKLIVGEVSLMGEQVWNECQRRRFDLSKDEAASIMIYTVAWKPIEKSFYVALNKVLNCDDCRALIPWFSYFELFFSAVKKLKKQPLNKFFHAVPNDFRKYFSGEKENFLFSSVLSFSTSLDFSCRFLPVEQEKTVFCVRSTSMFEITEFSFEKREKEFVLLPGAVCTRIRLEKFATDLNFIEFNQTDFVEPKFFSQISTNQNEKDFNLLFIGETGAGKTTFINSIYNYLFSNTLEDALQRDFKYLIPSAFTIQDIESFEEFRIEIGGSFNDNENLFVGHSATQSARSYCFPFGRNSIRFIDTPGVADVQGVHAEVHFFRNILHYIRQFSHLNAICIVVSSSQNQFNIGFRYALKELFRHLHVNTKKNVFFIFTNSRVTRFQRGAVDQNIKKILHEIRQITGVEISFDLNNSFKFDNECFRFLAAKEKGLHFLDEFQPNFSNSWTKSVDEWIRFIKCVVRIQPISINEILNLYHSQKQLEIVSGQLTSFENTIDSQNKQRLKQFVVELAEFIRSASLLPFDKDILQYLGFNLKEEEAKPDKSQAKIKTIKKVIQEYEQSLEIFQSLPSTIDVQQNSADFNKLTNECSDILKRIESFYALSIIGENIRAAYQEAAISTEFSYNNNPERVVGLPPDENAGRACLEVKKLFALQN